MRVIVCEHGLLQISKMYMRTRVKAVCWQDITGFNTGIHSSEISIHYHKDNRLFTGSLTINSAYERLDNLAALLEEHRQQFTPIDWKQMTIQLQPAENGKYRCPCCGYRTLNDRCEYELCAVCGWQDDGQDNWDATTNRPLSPNHMSLALARENYQRFGAIRKSALDSVRPPLPEEM
ncbi:hypothetical protein KDAU_55440 [Dictyobacter aurantiacus]|uniref:Cysteine-rich CPCC domain-containing protein n=2 Tax=Dictyobacter aurantiacus TaxID=1936993 RepID=A0A401ZMY2_9CHLR|nr:hypothetical protein KDAU_55440 [Dictyobacter aurantiacus]